MPIRLRRKDRSGVPLLELLILAGILGGLAVFATTAMRKARQRAVVAVLKPRGVKAEIDDSGWLSTLDATGIPDDRFSLDDFRGLRDIPALDLDHTEATDESLARLPSELGLTRLSLVGTAIGDAGCEEIARHTGLQHLDVRLTFVADDGLATLAKLENLQVLRLAQTWVTDAGLEPLKQLPKLAVLDLRDTAVTDEGLKTLRQLSALKQLLLKNADVTAEGVATLQSARPDLEIEHASGIDESVRIRLREPNLIETKREEFLTAAERAPLKSLRSEAFPFSRLENGYVKSLSAMARFRMLEIHVALLPRFRQLEWLNLNELDLTDAGLHHLSRNRMLAQVSVRKSKLTDLDLEVLARLPRLTHLWLDGLAVTEQRVRTLQQSRQLWWLSLNETSLSPEAIRLLKPLGLRHLEIEHARLGEAELKALAELDTLEKLTVSGNPFPGHAIRHLAKLKSLRFVNFSDTRVSNDEALLLLEFADTLQDVVLTRSRVLPNVLGDLRASGRNWKITH